MTSSCPRVLGSEVSKCTVSSHAPTPYCLPFHSQIDMPKLHLVLDYRLQAACIVQVHQQKIIVPPGCSFSLKTGDSTCSRKKSCHRGRGIQGWQLSVRFSFRARPNISRIAKLNPYLNHLYQLTISFLKNNPIFDSSHRRRLRRNDDNFLLRKSDLNILLPSWQAIQSFDTFDNIRGWCWYGIAAVENTQCQYQGHTSPQLNWSALLLSRCLTCQWSSRTIASL